MNLGLKTLRLLVAGGTLAFGCAGADRHVRMHFTHPSPLSRFGRRIGVDPFDNEGDSRMSQRIQQALQEANSFEIADAERQQMRVIGTVHETWIGPEEESEHPHTCTRLVPELRTREVPVFTSVPVARRPSDPPYYTPPPEMRVTYRTEQYTEMVSQPYSCTQLVRSIAARARVSVAVNALTRPIRQVYARDLVLEDVARATGLRGSDSSDGPPGPVDGRALLESILVRLTQQVARETLPRTGVVNVEFADCHDRRCDDALALARNGGWAPALTLLTSVVDGVQVPVDDGQRERLAAALFNRGVVRGFHGEIGDGIADIERAISVRLIDPAWARYLSAIQQLGREQDAASFRGETQSIDERHADDPEEQPVPPSASRSNTPRVHPRRPGH